MLGTNLASKFMAASATSGMRCGSWLRTKATECPAELILSSVQVPNPLDRVADEPLLFGLITCPKLVIGRADWLAT